MKPSEIYKNQAQEEDNNLKALALHTKSLREARLEKFDDYIILLEQKGCIIIPFNGSKVVIDTQTNYGVIDYFPKANKLLIRKENEWIQPGLKWIITNLIN
jgi:hypothetical protein